MKRKTVSLILTAVMALGVLTVAVSAGSLPFTDVKEGRWSYDAVSYAFEKGYMKGTSEDKFSPAGTMTRAMVVTVLFRREGTPAEYDSVTDGTMKFTDIPANEWYTEAVEWAYSTGVVNGLSETKFGPKASITREQLATMLYRYSENAPVSVSGRADLETFSDGTAVSGWAKEAVSWAVEAALVKGTDRGELDPKGLATREQFAAIMERYDTTFRLEYNTPVIQSTYTEKEYPPVEDADIYVSVNGDDSADGTLEHPLATFAKAAEAVRELKKTKTEGDIKVAFMAGNYGSLGISLTEEDSGTDSQQIVYCKYGDGDVIFDNGCDIKLEDFEDITEEEKTIFSKKAVDNIKKADISYLSGIAYDDLVLFSDSGMLWEARYPNKYTDGSDQLFECAATGYTNESLLLVHRALKRKILTYHTLTDMKVYGYLVRGYQKHLLKVKSYDEETGEIVISDYWTGDYYGHLNPNKIDCSMCFVNISEELDMQGEYWIDSSTGTLYIYNPDSDLHIPLEGTMINMDRASNITFRGLTFRNTREQFINERMGHGIYVELCHFTCSANNIGNMFLGSEVGTPKDLKFTENVFETFYGHVLKVDGECEGQYRFDKETKVVFDNNLVRRSNIVYDFRCAVDMPSCSNLLFSHNRFEQCSRGAISFSHSYDVVVEYNDFDSVMCNAQDGGILYADWCVDGRNLVVRYNSFGYVTTAGIGTFGFYVDDNTCGAVIYSNLFYNTGNCAAMINGGRDCDIHDNIMISTNEYDLGFGSNSPRKDVEELIDTIPYDESRDSVWADYQGEAFVKVAGAWGMCFDNIALYENYRNAIAERWPCILDYHINIWNRDDPNYLFNDVNSFTGNIYINKHANVPVINGNEVVMKYHTRENETGYSLDENPVFNNPTAGDYTVRDGVDFPDIQFEKIGRY